MTTTMSSRLLATAATAATALLSVTFAAPAFAQAQPDFRWEKALPAGSSVRLHNLTGDITVVAADVPRVEVIGVKHGRRNLDAITLEVVETADGIVVCPIYRDRDVECSEDGFRVRGRDRRWDDDDHDDVSIDIRVRMPRNLRVRAGSVSGDVTITGAEGEVRGSSVSGDVRLDGLRASSVRASSVSGNVDVVVTALTGEGPLEFNSVSGNVTAELPRNVNADVSMRTVSGTLDSDFPLTLSGRMSRSRLEARIGNGGRELEVHTVSGDVRLRAARQ